MSTRQTCLMLCGLALAGAPSAAAASNRDPVTVGPITVPSGPQFASAAVPARARAAREARPTGTRAASRARETRHTLGIARPGHAAKRLPLQAPTPQVSRLHQRFSRVVEIMPRWARFVLAGLIALALALGAAGILATLRSRRLERHRRLLAADVGLLQSAVLPVLPERVGPASVSAAYRPAEGLAAGGDFYDAFARSEDETCVLVGDVAGHGRESVPLSAHVRYTLRAYLEAGLNPRHALGLTSEAVGSRLGQGTATVAAAVYDARSGLLTYACAGHPPPVLVGVEHPHVRACSSPLLAAGLGTGTRQTSVRLPPGSAAWFHTDGVTDAVLDGGRLGSDWLERELRDVGRQMSASDLVEHVARVSDEQPDDIAACVLRPPAGGPVADGCATEELELDRAAVERGAGERFLEACGLGGAQARLVVSGAREIVDRGDVALLRVHDGQASAVPSPRPAIHARVR